jgi:hypothetical protein
VKAFTFWLIRQVVAWAQARCHHPGHAVSFDILEGDHEPTHVQRCQNCGAVCVRSGAIAPHNWRRVIKGDL